MTRLGLAAVVMGAAIGCGGDDGASNELGEATVDGEVMGESIGSGAIAWRGTISGTQSSLISIHKTGTACDTTITTGSNLRLQLNCPLESGSFTVVSDGSGNCPDQILATLDNDGEPLAFGSGGSIRLNMDEISVSGSFDIDFGDESLSGSFNLRDCGEVTPGS